MAQEIELKFLIESGGLPMLDSLPLIGKRLRHARRKHIETTYFDTPKRLFTGNGFALRVRKQDKGTLLSVKQTGSSGIGRGEWERPMSGDAPSAEDISATPAAALLRKTSATEALAPLYTVAVDRASFLVKEGSSQIEIAMDRGEIKHNGKGLPVCELELELKHGEPRQLFALARRFIEKAPLRLSFVSKGDRGDRLAEGSWGRPTSASIPKLNSDMTAAQAFCAICHSCLYDFMLNETALDEDGDIEGVHRTRIAIRRLRAALSLFRPVVTDGDYDPIGQELSWLSDLLGAARDFDVLQRETSEPPVHAGRVPIGADALSAEISLRRKEAHAALRQALQSGRMRKLLLDLAGWLDHGAWRTAEDTGAEKPVLKRAHRLLDKQFRLLCKRAQHLERADPEERHKIRITAKKLRYMSEFFDSLIAGTKRRRRFKKFVSALEAIQGALGELQDGEARTEFLEKLVTNMAGKEASNHAAITAYAAGVFTSVKRPREKKLIRKARKSFAKISGRKLFLQPS